MEAELIAWIRNRAKANSNLVAGIGDDAAVLALGGKTTIVSTDMLMDGIDFLSHAVDPQRIGHKCLAVNLSDLAAMAARPVAAVVSLALPRHGGLALAKRLYTGILPLAERFDVALAGGDTNSWDGPLVVSITVFGESDNRQPLLRSGARPGDRILVTGSFGGSILGRHLDVQPRVTEALSLADCYALRAGIDVSDSLTIDLDHICRESRCGAVVDTARVPIHPDADRLSAATDDGIAPLAHALSDGEDFELILAVPPDDAKRIVTEQPVDPPLTDIGEFVAGSGLWSLSPSGGKGESIPVAGYQHAFQ